MPIPPKFNKDAKSSWTDTKAEDGATPFPLPNVLYALELIKVQSRKSGNKANSKNYGRTFWVAEWRGVNSNSSDPAHRAGSVISTLTFDNNEFQQRDFARGLVSAYTDMYSDSPSEWSGAHMEWVCGPVLDDDGRPTTKPDGTVLASAKVTLITGERTSAKDIKAEKTRYTTYRYLPGHSEAERTLAPARSTAAPPRPPARTPVKKTGQEYNEQYAAWIDYDSNLCCPNGATDWCDIPADWKV